MSFLNEHAPDCKPLQPCQNCQAVIFLRSRLSTDVFKQFLVLLGVEDTTPCVTPVELDCVLETLDAFRAMSARTRNALKNDRVLTVQTLLGKDRNELLRTPNLGRKSLEEIELMVSQIGHTLGAQVT